MRLREQSGRRHTSGPPTALIATLCMLALARALLVSVPTMDAWSLNLQRFLPWPEAWGLWGLGVLGLMSGIQRRAARLTDAMGRATTAGAIGPATWAVAIAALVLLLPDRTWMTGDFILRQQAIAEGHSPAALFPQELPLDVWIHYTLPRWVVTHAGVSANSVARAWGALDATALAWAGVAFCRALRLRGAAALTTMGAIVFSGGLALFTGYQKGLADLVVIVVVMAALGARVVVQGSGYLALGAATAAAIGLHRVGALLTPAMLLGWGIAVRKHGISRRALAGLALPLVAAAVVGPKVWAVVTQFDVPQSIVHRGGVRHWVDLANALFLTAPLAPLVPVLGIACGPSLTRRPEIAPAIALALALGGIALIVEPQLGFLRDWDLFAPAGMAIAVLAAWLAGEVVSGACRDQGGRPPQSPSRSPFNGIALAVLLAAAVPSIQWLIHLNDAPLGLARVRAALAEPPSRSELERGRLWDYIGIRSEWLGDWDAAADAFQQSATALPTPRVLGQWADAEIRCGNWARARDVCQTWTSRAPRDLAAWRTLAAAATRLNDRPSSRVAAERILELDSTDADARAILSYLARTEPGGRRLSAATAP